MANEKLTVKDEHLIFYEIESNEKFDPDALSDEEKAAIEENHNKVEDALRKYLVGLAIGHACICQQSKVIQRAQRSAQLIQTGQAPTIRFEQNDVDNYVFGVVISSTNGIYREEPLCVVVWCQSCNSLQFFGDLRPLMRHLGNVYNKEIEAMSIPAGNAPAVNVGGEEAKKPVYVMKDLVTGEETPADSLASALFGASADPDSVKLEDAGSGMTKEEHDKLLGESGE